MITKMHIYLIKVLKLYLLYFGIYDITMKWCISFLRDWINDKITLAHILNYRSPDISLI